MSELEPERVYDPIRWKVGILILLFTVAFTVIIGRLFWVQVVEGARYREIAKKQYESKVPLRAERGRIFDREMRDIATMVNTTSFAADPSLIEQPEVCAQLIAAAASEPAEMFAERLKNKQSRFVWLARGINTVMFPVLDTIRDKGLIRVKEPKRHFTYGPVAAQLIGTTDIDNNGLTGLELQYDYHLRGKSGFVVMARDGRGRLSPVVNPERQAPSGGKGLMLTIDIEMQRIAEQELMRGVQETGATSGTVIAIEPSTGEVLAMASIPSFDPNRLNKATTESIRIKGITDQYEPGSTMKAITAAALLEERKIAPKDKVNGSNGLYTLATHQIRDDHALGDCTFQQALEQSSNIVFAKSSTLLNDRLYYKYVRDFGFGIPTGIDVPGEVRGMLKKPIEFDATTKMFMSYGYGISATALQMVNAYATIANGGEMMLPHCVKSIIAPSGKVETTIPPTTVRRVISEQTAKILTEMLVGVVENGTGAEAKISGVRIAGKTGTAQQLQDGSYNRTAYTASFVGYYPADAPRVAMIVMLDRPVSTIYGGSAAAPIFKRIVQKTMTILKLDVQTQKSIAASAEADSVIAPDVRGLTAESADTILHSLGLKIGTSTGTGLVVKQWPKSGTKIQRGTVVNVTCQVSVGEPKPPTKPEVVGFPLRRAITVLHAGGYEVRVKGTGSVQQQIWNGNVCTLIAR